MNNIQIIGAKKGAGKSRKANIAPDSAQSKTRIKILYGLSEGEISGLVDGAKSIYLEDTPLQAESGTMNYENVQWNFRSGTNDQEYIAGFGNISSEVGVGVELKQQQAWVKSFTNLELDAVIIRVRFGALRTTNPENGDVTGATVEYAIDVMTDGASWVEYSQYKVSDKTSANYERSHRVELPKAEQGWQIRVRRLTPDSNSDYLSDKSYVQAYTEVIDAKLAYPNTALLSLEYDAEIFSNVAKMSVECYGIKILVPSNYDPVSRTYNGIWDGTFKREYTNNPAWHFYDVCINKRYGLGDKINSSMIDKWSVYRLGQYCDEMVSDGKGGLEPRFTLNVYEQSQDGAWSLLSKMAGAFRAYVYWDGQAIVIDADMPQDTYFTYTPANVIDGMFERSGTSSYARHTQAKVAWNNPQNQYKTEYLPVRDEEAIAKYGVKTIDIQAYGCTSESQAYRAGLWALKSEQLETQTITFKVGLDGMLPIVGKVIEVADPLFAGRANGGRIFAINDNKTQITLDRDDVICRAGDRLVVNAQQGKAETRIIKSIQGRIITVVAPFEHIDVEHIWAIDAQDLATIKYRVLSVVQNEDHQFTVQAIEYNPAKYDVIDYGAIVDDRPKTLVNPMLQDPVPSVEISSSDMVQQGLNIATMVISFPQVKGATKYLVEWKKDDGNWIKLPLTGTNSVEVQGIYDGKYQARVTAISAFDMASLATYSALTQLKGKAGKPPKLAKITATGTLFGMKLDWAFSAKSEDTAYTEIQVSPDGRSNIATLGQFAYPTDTHQIQGLQGNLTQYYRAKIVDKLGNESDWTEWTSGTTSADPQAVLDILEGQINESTLDNILTGKINTAVTTGVANTNAINKEIRDRTTAVQTETQARVTAINNEAKARTAEINQRVIALNSEIGTTLAGLQNGLTQETQQRKDADSQTLSALNAYKVSNDNAVSAILAKADNAISVNNAQASQINALQSSVTTVQNGLLTKLDSSAIINYYTKAQADEKIQQVTTGKIEEFNANLTIGGVNILPNSHIEKTGANEHLYYAILPELKEFYLNNPTVTISFDIKVPVAGRVQVYTSNNSGVLFYSYVDINESNKWVRKSVTVNPKPHPNNPNINQATLEFYGTYNTGRIPTVKNVKIESGNKTTDWTPALSDVDGKINANAQAINTINSNVSNLNNTLTSQSQQLTQLRNDLTLTNTNVATKADTTALNTLDSRVTQANDRITAESQKIIALQNSLNTVNGTLNSKADSSALSNLNTTVQNINGAVTTQANQITQLESGLNTVNQTLNNKVNASALSDYYTKTQADNVMSGKIDEFKTSLVIGGENILRGTAEMKIGNGRWDSATFRQSGSGRLETVNITDSPVKNINKGLKITPNTTAEYGYAQDLYLLDVGMYTFSFWINGTAGDKVKIQPFWANQNQNIPYQYVTLKGGWEYFSFTGENKVGNIQQSIGYIYLKANAVGNSAIVVAPMLEKATIASAWQPSQFDVDSAINANSQAISVINSNVNNLNNTVISQGQAITQLNNNLTAMNANVSQKADSTALTALDNKVTQQENSITSQASQITNLTSRLDDNNLCLNPSMKENNIGWSATAVRTSLDNEYVIELTNRDAYYTSPYVTTANQGDKFYFRAKLKVKDSTHRMRVGLSGNYISNNGSFWLLSFVKAPSEASNWIDVYGYLTVPSDLKNVKLWCGSEKTANTAGNWYIKDVVFKRVDNALNDLIDSKADSTAFTTLQSRVNTIDGKVNTQAQQITTLTTQQNSQSTTISQQTQTINGISAVRAVTVDNNGVISGYGLMSELRNGRVTSQFGVNADTFYIGSPTNGKKPFIFNASPRVIEGVSYPAGTFINTAFIANASIGLAKINKASINSLSALSATIGVLRTKDKGARTEIKDNLIEVYDENNILRVKLGVWN